MKIASLVVEIIHQLVLERGLLLTEMEIRYRGQVLKLNRVLIDTGSASTIISSDLAASIGLVPEDKDPISRICGVGGYEYVYSKIIDSIKIGEKSICNLPVEIGAMDYGFNLEGILGIDVLKGLNAMINMTNLSLE